MKTVALRIIGLWIIITLSYGFVWLIWTMTDRVTDVPEGTVEHLTFITQVCSMTALTYIFILMDEIKELKDKLK